MDGVCHRGEGLGARLVLYRAKPITMKHPLLPFVCTALLLAVPAGAQVDRKEADRFSLKIIQTEDPVFPLGLQNSPVMSGEAKVAIDVDEKGQLTDWLVTAYSRKEFADSAVAACGSGALNRPASMASSGPRSGSCTSTTPGREWW